MAAQLYDIDLLDAYSAATRPYIVSFDMAVAGTDAARQAVQAACWYLCAATAGTVAGNTGPGFNGRGVAVPPTAIRDVGLVER